MTYETNQYDRERGDSGAGFVLGLLSGVVLGVGVGLLLAPRSGAEIRQSLAQSASDLQRTATDSYNQVSHKVREAADRGRDMVNRATERWNERRQESPAGTGAAHGHYLEPGDTVRAQVEGLGDLITHIG